jgi:uncharacterized protein YodC (DUF2158 family)
MNVPIEFVEGDIAALRSGGPRMTVDDQDKDGVLCRWFVEGYLCYAVFKPNMLQILELSAQRKVS